MRPFVPRPLQIALSFLLLLIAKPHVAQESAPPDPLHELIAAGHRPMARTDEGFVGPGATLLLQGAEESMFVLVGESHGNVETPALTSWLLRAIRPYGYAALAVEVGPVVAEKMEALAAEKEPMAAFQAFHEAWPFTIPFFFWKEEVAMWLEAHELEYDLWGLDQEFIGSGRYLLSELARRVEDDAARSRIAAWQDTADEGFRVFSSSGDSSRGFLNVVDPDELENFGRSLPATATEARRIVEELRQTAIVYQHYRDKRYYLNNYDRIRLMKHHLAEIMHEAGGLEALPRALFKFGSVHMGRGYSPMRQLDLGNAAAELAAARFSDSFHVNVTTLRSTAADGTVNDWTEQAPELALLAGHLEKDRWGIFDLRTMRRHFAAPKNREAHPEMAEMVYRYDVLALAPAFHAATPMIDLPF